MSIPKDGNKLENARELRQNMTPHERKIWYLFLQKYPVKIYKQRIIGPYIVDFYCASAKLVIEIDGSQHFDDEGQLYDTSRSAYLQRLGLHILRCSNADIDYRFEQVCESIHLHIEKYKE